MKLRDSEDRRRKYEALGPDLKWHPMVQDANGVWRFEDEDLHRWALRTLGPPKELN